MYPCTATKVNIHYLTHLVSAACQKNIVEKDGDECSMYRSLGIEKACWRRAVTKSLLKYVIYLLCSTPPMGESKKVDGSGFTTRRPRISTSKEPRVV